MKQGAHSSKLRITFLLPRTGGKPIGGFKVTYEYANYLASQGHIVSVVHPIIFRVDQPLRTFKPKARVRAILRYFELKITRGYRPDGWFRIDPKVKLLWVPSLAARHIPDGDVVIATAWETAEWVPSYPASKGRRFYLIQHLETWGGLPERTLATWKAPLQKIAIAGWLQRHAAEMGESAYLIPNGLDFRSFRLTRPPEERDRHKILMLHHQLEWKGSADGLAAFAIAQAAIPELRLTLFGIFPRPDDLPEDIVYHHRPSQETINELYNEAAIFVGPSWLEGWGLPPAEALMCGAAIGGHGDGRR